MKTIALWLCLPLLAAIGEPKSYVLKDGKVIRAEILAVNGDQIEMQVHMAAGQMKAAKPLSDFAPQSAFKILRSVTDRNDIAGHFKLAEFAAEHNLIATARRELRHCRTLAAKKDFDPEVEKQLVGQALSILRTLLTNMIEDGKTKDVRYVLSQIMTLDSDRFTDEDKAGLVDLVQTSLADKTAAEASARRANEDDATRSRREKLLKPVQDGMDRGRAARRKGMLSSKNFSSALGAFDRAIKEFEAVQRRCESIRKKNSNDKVLLQELDSITESAHGYVSSTLLDQASLNLTRGQINEAMGRVNKILGEDPTNRQALAMRARIEIAANEASGFGRGR